jgi:type IV pilus assembly protein PilA
MSKRHLLVLAVSAVFAAGCGDDDDDGGNENGGGESTAAIAQQDADAKTNARNLVTEVEACFVDQQSYSGCEEPEGTELSIGSDAGQVEVSAASNTGYTVVAHSESGTDFTIEKAETGELSRTCDEDGKGGCKAGGTW